MANPDPTQISAATDAALDFLNSSVLDSSNDSGDDDENTEDPTGLPNPHSRRLQHIEMFLTPPEHSPCPRRIKRGAREPQPLHTFIPQEGGRSGM